MRDLELAREIVFPCQACGRAVEDGDGSIIVNATLAAQVTCAYDRFDELWRQGIALGGLPAQAAWHAYHAACDPDPGNGHAYSIAVERARTVGRLLDWGTHLGRKSWIDGTNWTDFLLHHAFGLEIVP